MDKGIESLPDATPQEKQAKAGLEVYRKLFKAVGSQVACFAVGLAVDDDAALAITNKAKLIDGPLQSALEEMPQPPENLLVGLPNAPYVMAGAGAMDKNIMGEMMKFSFSMMEGMPGMMGETEEQKKKFMELSMKTIDYVDGMGMVFGIPKEEGLFLGGVAGVMWTTDIDAYMKAYAEQIEMMAELSKEASTGSWFKGMKQEKADIDGISGWKVSVDLSSMFELMKDQPQSVEMVKRMYGESGVITTYFAPAGKNYVVYAYCPDMLKKAIAAVENEDATLAASEEIQKVAGKLTQNPGWVGYLSPTGIVAMINATMKNVGQSIKLPDFPETAPIGFCREVRRRHVHQATRDSAPNRQRRRFSTG